VFQGVALSVLPLIACALLPGQPKTAVSGAVRSIGRIVFTLDRGRLIPAATTVAAGTYIIRLDNGSQVDADLPFGLIPGAAAAATQGAQPTQSFQGLQSSELVANKVTKSAGRSRVVLTLKPGAYTLVVGANTQWRSRIIVTDAPAGAQ
jgi:hypothetical protein